MSSEKNPHNKNESGESDHSQFGKKISPSEDKISSSSSGGSSPETKQPGFYREKAQHKDKSDNPAENKSTDEPKPTPYGQLSNGINNKKKKKEEETRRYKEQYSNPGMSNSDYLAKPYNSIDRKSGDLNDYDRANRLNNNRETDSEKLAHKQYVQDNLDYSSNDMFRIHKEVIGTGAGKIITTPESEFYPKGTRVTVSIKPDPGSKFIKWDMSKWGESTTGIAILFHIVIDDDIDIVVTIDKDKKTKIAPPPPITDFNSDAATIDKDPLREDASDKRNSSGNASKGNSPEEENAEHEEDNTDDYDSKQSTGAARTAVKAIKIGAISMFAFFILIPIIILTVFGSTVATLGDKLVGFNGITKEDLKPLEDMDPQILAEIKKSGGEEAIYAALDCSNFPPAERKPGETCIEGLLASLEERGKSAVPRSAYYLVPIWQAAGKKYKIPWQVLAAVNAARTNFGQWNCETGSEYGFYRSPISDLRDYGVEAGFARIVSNGGDNCYRISEEISKGEAQSIKPPESNKKDKKEDKNKKEKERAIVSIKTEPLNKLPDPKINKVRYEQEYEVDGEDKATRTKKTTNSFIGNQHDPVDATFTEARKLATLGAFDNKKWEYSGSPSNACTTSNADGKIYYVPKFGAAGYGAGAKMGYNKKLDIPRSVVRLAAKYRSNKGKYKPRRDDDPSDAKIGDHRIPKKHLVKMLTAAWKAFGVRGAELNRNVTLNYKQIGLESGGRPYILQGHIGDVNDDNPARGLFQYIPSTFKHWKVDGFNDVYNPIDNILATVNAQVNGPYKILDGASGWSPPLSKNPYATGGKAEVVDDSTEEGKAVTEHGYKGDKQKDDISKAVKNKDYYSNCYVAVVHDWYKAIVENPPDIEMAVGGPFRERILAIARAELKKNVHETGSDNVPRYHPNNKIAPYSISAAWCQSFAAHVWYWAGAKQLNKLGGMKSHDGLTVPSYTGAMTAAAEGNPKLYGKVKKNNPEPGDFAMYGTTHVEIVEKVQGGKVVATIGGNTSDSVMRHQNPSGITHFIEPPTKYGKGSYKGKLPGLGSGSEYADAGDDKESFRKLEKSAKADISIVAMTLKHDNTNTKAFGSLEPREAFSTIKVPLLIALINKRGGSKKLSEKEKNWSKDMIVKSDNDSAKYIYNNLGGNSTKRRRAVQDVLQKSGDKTTYVSKIGRGGLSSYGQTMWSPVESTRTFKALANKQLTDKKSTSYVLKLMKMEKPKDQQWGFTKADYGDPAYKGGWGPMKNKKYVVRQSGINGDWAVTIIVRPDSGKYEDGAKAVTKAAEWIKERIGDTEESRVTLDKNNSGGAWGEGKLILKGRTTCFSGEGAAAGAGWNANRNPGVALNLKPGTESGWNNKKTDKWMTAANKGKPYFVRIVNKYAKKKSMIVPIIDKGPAGWTNNAVDITMPAADKLAKSKMICDPSQSASKVFLLGQAPMKSSDPLPSGGAIDSKKNKKSNKKNRKNKKGSSSPSYD